MVDVCQGNFKDKEVFVFKTHMSFCVPKRRASSVGLRKSSSSSVWIDRGDVVEVRVSSKTKQVTKTITPQPQSTLQPQPQSTLQPQPQPKLQPTLQPKLHFELTSTSAQKKTHEENDPPSLVRRLSVPDDLLMMMLMPSRSN